MVSAVLKLHNRQKRRKTRKKFERLSQNDVTSQCFEETTKSTKKHDKWGVSENNMTSFVSITETLQSRP